MLLRGVSRYNNHTGRCTPQAASLYTMPPAWQPVLPTTAPPSGPAPLATADTTAAQAVSSSFVLEVVDHTAQAASILQNYLIYLGSWVGITYTPD